MRHIIPISTSRGRDCPPGLLEVDTVAHCGDTLQGQFAWTLNTTDVATGWVAFAPVIGTSAQAMVPALEHIVVRAPFPVYEIHSDNGSEFINNHLVWLCHKCRIRMTRGRPGCKNNNPRIEQKNWTQVRQIVGYRRYETPANCGNYPLSITIWNASSICLSPAPNCIVSTGRMPRFTEVTTRP